MSESEFPNGLMGVPRVRKLKRVNDVLGNYTQVFENSAEVEELLGTSERPYVARSRKLSARVAQEEGISHPVWDEAPQRRLAEDSAVPEQPAPSWSQGEEPNLNVADERRLAEEEQPHWAEADATRWGREEEEERRAAQAERARLAREEEERKVREQAELVARERERARMARAEEARLAQEDASRLAKEESVRAAQEEEARRIREQAEYVARQEAARLAREAEQARLAQEEEARLAREVEAARLAKEAEAQATREELARLAREREARFAEQEKARLAWEEAEQLAREAEEDGLAREEEAQAAREEAARLAQEEVARLAREARELKAAPHPEATRLGAVAATFAHRAVARLEPVDPSPVPTAGFAPVKDAVEALRDTAPIPLPDTLPEMEPPVRKLVRIDDPTTSDPWEPPLTVEAPTDLTGSELLRQRVPEPSPDQKLPAIHPRVRKEKLLEEQGGEGSHDELQEDPQEAQARLKIRFETARLHAKVLAAEAKVQRMANREPMDFNLGAWLAGAGPTDLRACSDSERRKISSIGYTVLVPTIFALMSASYAVATLTPNPYVITLVAVAWAAIILLVDRAIIATYSPSMKLFSKIGVITLRFCVAMLMGMTVSHPLTLLLFRDTIDTQIEDQRDHELAAAREKFAKQKTELESKLADRHADVERQRKLFDESYETKIVKPATALGDIAPGALTPEEQAILKQRTEDAAQPFREELAEVASRLQSEEARRVQLQTELDDWQRQFEAEIGGQRSGVSGIGPRARSIQTDQIDWRRADLTQIAEEVRKLSARKREIETSISASGDTLRREMERVAAERALETQRDNDRLVALQKQVQAQQMANFVSEGEGRRKQIQTAIDSGLADLTRLRTELEELASQEEERLEHLRSNPRRDMLTQTLALHHLFEDPKNGGHFALVAYLVLAGLFLAIDTMPILVKFTSKPGEYEVRRERSLKAAKEGDLAHVPARLRELQPAESEALRDLVVGYHRNEQQEKVYEKEKQALVREAEMIEAMAKRDAAQADREEARLKREEDLALKKQDLEERKRRRELEVIERERKLAAARKAAELEKLELAAKEAEANEAKARAHLSRVELEIAESDGGGFGELLLDRPANVEAPVFGPGIMASAALTAPAVGDPEDA